jgi:hypothetical protein
MRFLERWPAAVFFVSSGASLARIYAYNHFGLHPEPLLGWFEKYMGGAARPDRAEKRATVAS